VLAYRRPDGAEMRIQLQKDVTTLGRSDTCAIVLPVATVSRLHATIELEHDRYFLRDTGSANGTFVNGGRIEQPHQLTTGSEIWLGSPDATLWFSDPEETLAVELPSSSEPLLIDERTHTVQVHGVSAALSPLEYELLRYLAVNQNTVCTREASFLEVWGQLYDHTTCEHALNTCIAKLRRNLRAAAEEADHEPPQIVTIPRVGFRLVSEVSFAPPSAPTPLRERSVEM
jgi:pSer/pThr/pTyr-binding forkhead associated (FHA) protein